MQFSHMNIVFYWFPPSTDRCAAQSFGCERTSQVDPTIPFYVMCLGLCLFLVRWSVICCQDGCLTAFAKGALPEEYLSRNFDEQCLGGHWAYLMPFLP